MVNEDRLKCVVVECLVAEVLELVHDVGEHCRLGVDLIILSALSDYTAFDIAEKT